MLENIITEGSAKPPIILMHGPAGSGKTQVAIDSGALVLQTEDGHRGRKGPRLKVADLDSFYSAIKELGKSDHQFKAIALDSLDHLVPLVADYVCKAHGKPTLEAFGFGKGQIAETDEWRKVMRAFLWLRDTKQMPVFLIAHQRVRPVVDPLLMDGYDRLEAKLPKAVNELVRELVDAVGGVVPKLILRENEQEKTKAIGDGSFLVHFWQSPSMDAKNCAGIRQPISYDYNTIAKAFALAPKE